MEISCNRFAENAAAALGNEKLQRALGASLARFMLGRQLAFAKFPEGERLRDLAREIKRHTIEHLDEYLEKLEASVLRLGGQVHWARTAEEACEIIGRIALERGAKSVVKSKSMVTEEIGLNEALERLGVRAIETDLGEFIVQLARERPSHILAPAIHKSRHDVGELFSRELGAERSEEIERLTAIARRELRERFARAEMGVTGVNFAVAETGTIVLVENEGNIRLSTTLPRVHVAVMGMEKVVPTLEDLAVFLKVLPPSATGQKLTSYVSFITGPRRGREADGAEEFHLVILDNGRSRILADEKLRESLYCLRCGACLNFCPVYRKAGGHAYGWVYSGPIGAIIAPPLLGLENAHPLPYASTLCGACRDVCPVKIDIPHLLLRLRAQISQGDGGRPLAPLWQRMAFKLWAWSMSGEKRYRAATALARFALRLFMSNGAIRKLPLIKWTESRDFPAPARQPFRELWRKGKV